MTGAAVLKIALALIGETDPTGYEEIGLDALNVVISECFEVNNRIREKRGEEMQESAPVLTALQEEIPMEQQLQISVIPYGLAAKLTAEDRDAALLGYLHQSYVNAMQENDRGYVALSGGISI